MFVYTLYKLSMSVYWYVFVYESCVCPMNLCCFVYLSVKMLYRSHVWMAPGKISFRLTGSPSLNKVFELNDPISTESVVCFRWLSWTSGASTIGPPRWEVEPPISSLDSSKDSSKYMYSLCGFFLNPLHSWIIVSGTSQHNGSLPNILMKMNTLNMYNWSGNMAQ